ncbi:hypothetical protein C2845_PM07G30850 [Panicum miliaceum]|uniref:PDZ domain-containing protein n=1 Tax=Panicum miliaceum TaxID=4540 RepID=A0A3L6SMM4_PANMI|nr:hypothetical protein C2845_PM07G30850 [Panicum miliaceum]
MEERGQVAPSPTEQEEEAEAVQKNQPGKASAAIVGQGSRASAAAPRLRYPPMPTPIKHKDMLKWYKECERISEILDKDIDYDIPTMRKPKDPLTTKAVKSSKDKEVVLRAARNIVIVSYMMDVACMSGRKRDPLPKLSVTLPDKKTVLDAALIYFNDRYNIALLYIDLDFTLELPSTGCHPQYGEEVFVLARDGNASLRVRCGNIKWLEESGFLGRDHYMFLSSAIPEGGNGGMVIDHDGGFRGMAVHSSPDPAVTSISTIEKFIDMFMRFNRVARLILGIDIRTIARLDVQLQEDISDFGVKGGFLVDEVYNPVSEELGIKSGNVIISINGLDVVRLPELEDYLLSLGWHYLMDKSTCMKEFKLRVFDLKSGVERYVTVPIRYYDKSEQTSTKSTLFF